MLQHSGYTGSLDLTIHLIDLGKVTHVRQQHSSLQHLCQAPSHEIPKIMLLLVSGSPCEALSEERPAPIPKLLSAVYGHIKHPLTPGKRRAWQAC